MKLEPPWTLARVAAHRAEQAALMPQGRYGSISDLREETPALFEAALAAKKEEAIQRFLTENPYLLQYAINNSGHHGVWAFPKSMIRTTGADRSPGQIPDFLVASRSSLGYRWTIVELKRSDQQFANASGSALSSTANLALTQCQAYLIHLTDYIGIVRANIRVGQLIQPEGAVILIGDSTKETDAQREVRANFARTSTQIDVVSYNRIRQKLASDVRATVAKRRAKPSSRAE
jgi:hypothetical protein